MKHEIIESYLRSDWESLSDIVGNQALGEIIQSTIDNVDPEQKIVEQPSGAAQLDLDIAIRILSIAAAIANIVLELYKLGVKSDVKIVDEVKKKVGEEKLKMIEKIKPIVEITKSVKEILEQV